MYIPNLTKAAVTLYYIPDSSFCNHFFFVESLHITFICVLIFIIEHPASPPDAAFDQCRAISRKPAENYLVIFTLDVAILSFPVCRSPFLSSC